MSLTILTSSKVETKHYYKKLEQAARRSLLPSDSGKEKKIGYTKTGPIKKKEKKKEIAFTNTTRSYFRRTI